MFANNPRIVTNGLVGAWDALMPNTATAATKLYDAAGSNDGTMYNGSCLDFDGTDDYVEIATTYEPGNGNWALSMWINTDTWGTYSLMGNTSGGPSASRYFVGPTLIGFSNYDGAWQHHYGNTTLSLSTWYFCTWVNYAGSSSTNGTMKMFVNGVADSSAVNSYTTNGGRLNAIGQNTGSYFDGRIADVRFYNVALSDANVKELYDDSKVIIPTKNDASGGFAGQTNLKRWWTFAEGAGTICYDALGYTKYATMTNMTSADWLTGQTGAPQLVEGYNRPMTFDGSDDVVANISLSLPTGTASRTIAAWVWLDDATSSDGVFGYGTGPSTPYQVFEFYNYGSSGIRLHYATYNSGGATALSSKTWYHLAGTYDGTTAKVYINGALNHTDTVTLATVSSFARFGCVSYSSSPSDFVKGNINEVVFYDAALSLAQVQALAATDPNGGPLPPDPMSLSNSSDVVGYWRNDGAVTWADRSGSGYTGTVAGSPDTLLFKQGINGSASTSTGRDSQGFPLLYQNNGAVGFNGAGSAVGSGEYISYGTCPTILEMAQTSDTTILAWIKIGRQQYENGIISAFYSTGATGWSLNSWVSASSPYVAMLVSDGADGSGAWVTQAGTPLPEITADGKFHQVAVTIRRVAGYTVWYFYQDGVKNPTPRAATWEGGAAAWGSGRELIIGRGALGWGDFNGQIGSVQIYKTILSDAQIVQNYKAMQSRFNV